MYSEKDFQFYVKNLTSDDLEDIAYAVGDLTAIDAVGDERLLPLLEPLLEDERIVGMPAAPPAYCEVRWLAAKAIDKQRYLLELPPRNISRLGFIYPGSYGTMSAFATEKTGVDMMNRPRIDNTIEELEYLKKLGALPVCTSSESPYLDYSTLPK